MSTKGAPSSVAFGSHQRCGAPCKVAKRPLFPHLGEGYKVWRLAVELLSFKFAKKSASKKDRRRNFISLPQDGEGAERSEADEGAKFADIIRHLAIS